jgi:plastocyanin
VDGSYLFTGLRPGTYRLVETQPTLYRDGKDTAGTSGGNATAMNDHITGIVLASGATATGYLFGEHATADVIVTMTPASTTVAPGGQVTITYTVKNRGTAIANAVAVSLTYGGLTFVSSNSTDFDNTTKKWTVGDLAAGATQTITVTFRAPAAGGTFGPAAHATTTSTELSTANNSDSSTVFAGVTPPPQPTGGSGGSLWFLSSSTNAQKIPR